MTDPDRRPRALVVAPDRTPMPLANLAQRTLASLKAPESGIVASRQLIVGADGSAMFRTIAAALTVAGDGDEILVRPGEYRESPVIDRSVVVRGDGPPERIVIRPLTRGAPCIAIEGGAPHLVGLTIDGTEFDSDEDVGPVLLEIRAGSPTVEAVHFMGAGGVEIGGPKTAGVIFRCTIYGSMVSVDNGASPRIEDNEIMSANWSGVHIGGEATDPVVRANRIQNSGQYGITVNQGASPRIEDNDIWGSAHGGIKISGEGTDPLVRGNRIQHVGFLAGIWVGGGASPRIEDNDISGHLHPDFYNPDFPNPNIGISGNGTDPLVCGNRIHDAPNAGISVVSGASPRIEDNEIWATLGPAIDIRDVGTSPRITRNTLRDGFSDGIYVSNGATPSIRYNTVTGNALLAIRVDDEAKPSIGPNETDG